MREKEGKRVPKESPHKGRAVGVKGAAGRGCRPAPYPYEIKRRAVQLYREEGIPGELVARELGVSDGSVYEWARRYEVGGEAGLREKAVVRSAPKAPQAVREKITALKREDPRQGVKRISQVLRRFFFLKASPETVRRHLKATGLGTPKKKARKKPKAAVRRFERSTPNQMWQSDITVFPILGKPAYIIGFIDDHSRYVIGLGLYRSQPSAYVVDLYRGAAAEHGAPKEMLTDNGRQYASWRGTTKFQQELKKDHVHHIRSSPHHPMTLGKIERFWQTLKEEFLGRARFETFEEARERLAYWVKYYNHKRPHQALDGMTPADRFFSIQREMREAIERGVAANVEELALRGKPVEPFYLVGRVGDKSVVIETENKRMSVRVDGAELAAGQAMMYERKEGGEHEDGTGGCGDGAEAAESDLQRERKEPGGAGVVERSTERVGADEGVGGGVGRVELLGEAGARRDVDGVGSVLETAGGGSAATAKPGGEASGSGAEAGIGRDAGNAGLKREEARDEDHGNGSGRSGGEVSGGVGGVDGTAESVCSVSGDGGERGVVLAVARSGALGYAGGAGAAGNGGLGGAGVAGTDQASAGSQGPGAGVATPGPDGAQASDEERDPFRVLADGLLSEEVKHGDGGTGPESGRTDADDPGASGRAPHGDAGGAGSGGEPQDVLRMAGPGQGGDLRVAEGSAGRSSIESGGPREGTAASGVGSLGEGARGVGESAPHSGSRAADDRRDGAPRATSGERIVAA